VALAGFERRWAEALFAAILAPETAALPPFERIDRAEFWRCLDEAPGPLFGIGLRAMVHALTFLPLADRRHRKPFFALAPEDRRALVAELDRQGPAAVRQVLTALKMLACMAYFDDPAVRARFGTAP
jgi:hypothetical protein